MSSCFAKQHHISFEQNILEPFEEIEQNYWRTTQRYDPVQQEISATNCHFLKELQNHTKSTSSIVYRNSKKVRNERTYTVVVAIVRKFKRRTVKGTHTQFVEERRKDEFHYRYWIRSTIEGKKERNRATIRKRTTTI